jgi:hypothetical protein
MRKDKFINGSPFGINKSLENPNLSCGVFISLSNNEEVIT